MSVLALTIRRYSQFGNCFLIPNAKMGSYEFKVFVFACVSISVIVALKTDTLNSQSLIYLKAGLIGNNRNNSATFDKNLILFNPLCVTSTYLWVPSEIAFREFFAANQRQIILQDLVFCRIRFFAEIRLLAIAILAILIFVFSK